MLITIKQTSISNNAYWKAFEKIQKEYSTKGNILEVGSSDPLRTSALRRTYSNLMGLDINFDRISQIKNIKLCNADAVELPFKDKVFDGVISHHVIEHIEDDSKFIKEIYRVLKDRGFAIIGTPNRDRLASIAYGGLISIRKFPWREHKREYSRRMLCNLLSKCLVSKFKITGSFIGIHTSKFICGFIKCPKILERWCNFWFVTIVK